LVTLSIKYTFLVLQYFYVLITIVARKYHNKLQVLNFYKKL
jgi:hypothetical protein